MSEFKNYYNSHFRTHINKFFESIPIASKFHDDLDNKQIFSIQNSKLFPESPHLNFLSHREKEFFGVALYYTVLFDMVCFTHFRSFYPKFQGLTRYPKFIGDCPSGCRYHFEPYNIFLSMNRNKMPNDAPLIFNEVFTKSIPVIKLELHDFIINYMPELPFEQFWTKCENNFFYK